MFYRKLSLKFNNKQKKMIKIYILNYKYKDDPAKPPPMFRTSAATPASSSVAVAEFPHKNVLLLREFIIKNVAQT